METNEAAYSHEIKRLKQEVASLRLTKSERFVLQEVRDIYADEDDVKFNEIAAVIDGLLERATANTGATMTDEVNDCRCGLATRLVGDGCEHCNPAMMIDILREQVADMRLTIAEGFVLREVRDTYADDVKCNEIAAVIDGLLERTKYK